MFVDGIHHLGGEQDGVKSTSRGEARIAVAKTDHARDSISIGQGQDNGANHVVQSRTKPATRDNAASKRGWIKKNLRSRTSRFECWRRLPGIPKRL